MRVACEDIRKLLDPYLDNELTGEEVAAVEQHLTSCQKCAFESTQLLRLKEVVGRWQGPTPSGRMRANVLQRVREDLARSGTPLERYYRRLALNVTAAVLLVAGFGILAYHLLGVLGERRVERLLGHEPALAAAGSPPANVIAIVEAVTGSGVQVVRSNGGIEPVAPPVVLKAGETIEVTEDATATVRVAGGRLVLGVLAWQGRVPKSAPPSGLTRMRFASPEGAYLLERGAARITASGEGVGAIRIRTPAGIVYVPFEKMHDENTRALLHIAGAAMAIGVTAGEAGLLEEEAGSRRNVPVKKGELLEIPLKALPLPASRPSR